jgi:glycosyltransferase involved in cell wall biosynthesis
VSASPIRVVLVSPEPTPYRAPLLDRVAARPEVELFVVYASQTVAGREWRVVLDHPHVVLDGVRLPLPRSLLAHDYAVDPAVWRVLGRRRPDVVVASGWSTFASQAAIVWARRHRVPYLVVSESHEQEPRAGWRRALKRVVLPGVLGRAAGVLVTGSLAREHALRYGVSPDRVAVFANTVDVDSLGARIGELRKQRDDLRSRFGAEPDAVLVLSVARLAPEKGLDSLAEAVRRVSSARLVIAGEGPERRTLERMDGVILLGNLEGEALLAAYAAADVFALLPRREPWGVVVNEAAAAGLPLVLSDRVGAARDLLRPGENGELVPPEDAQAAAAAIERLAADARLRERYGGRSRELAADWGYEPNVDRFVDAVRAAVGLRP